MGGAAWPITKAHHRENCPILHRSVHQCPIRLFSPPPCFMRMMGDFRTIPLATIFRVRISVVYFLNRVTENLSWNSLGAKRTEYSVEILGTRLQPVLTHYDFALPNYLRSSPNCPRSPQNVPKLCIWVYSVAYRVFFKLDS